jgi:hypothetical protein
MADDDAKTMENLVGHLIGQSEETLKDAAAAIKRALATRHAVHMMLRRINDAYEKEPRGSFRSKRIRADYNKLLAKAERYDKVIVDLLASLEHEASSR